MLFRDIIISLNPSVKNLLLKGIPHSFLLIAVVIATSLIACRKNQSGAEKLVNDWRGKRITIVPDMESIMVKNDSFALSLFEKECKILVYVNSYGCVPCKVRMEEWKELLRETQPIADRISIVFIFWTQDFGSVKTLFHRYDVQYPAFIDKNGIMYELNRFPEGNDILVFLLNQKNDVVLIGSPIDNPVMWNLYRSQINSLTGLQDSDWPLRNSGYSN